MKRPIRSRGSHSASNPIEMLEQRRLLSAGWLDPTFNTVGKVIQPYRSTADGVATVVQSDNKVVVVGDTQQSGATKDAFVSRYNDDGSVDTLFGTNGVTFLNFGANVDDIATGVTLDGSGKIVVCGLTGKLSTPVGDFWVARFNTDGTLDNLFNAGGAIPGTKVVDMGGVDAASDVKILNGNIVVVGISTRSATIADQTFNVADAGAAVLVLDSSGGIVAQHTVQNDPGTIEGATALALTHDGGFVTSGFQVKVSAHRAGFGVGFSVTSMAMAQFFDASGNPNFGIGDNGKVLIDFGKGVQLGMGVAVDPGSGAVVIAGAAANGVVDQPPGFAASFPASTATASDFAIARLTSAGQLDTTFNTTGTELVDFKTGVKSDVDAATDVVIQSDHKIVVSGATKFGTNVDFATVRINTDGTPDATFGVSSQQRTDFGASDGSFGMAIMSNDQVVEVGHTKVNAGQGSVAILRYTNDASAVNSSTALVAVTSVKVGKLPATVVGGQPNAKTIVTVNVTEIGDKAVSGLVTVTVTGDGAAIGTKTMFVKLGIGKSVPVMVPVKFANPASDSDVVIAATVSSPLLPISATAVAASSPVHVQHAHVDLTGSNTAQPARGLVHGKPLVIKAPLTNGGNVQAKGKLNFDLIISSTSDVGGAIGSPTPLVRPIALAAGKTGNVILVLPAVATAGLAPGSYFVLVRLTSSVLTTANNTTDGSIVAVVPVTVT